MDAPTKTGPTLDDIRAAAERVKGAVIRTPMMKSDTLSQIVDAEVWLKFENLQFTAAYKERGALNKLLQLTDEERSRGVIAASADNHAQAVAYHGRRLGIPVTIVMPVSTPMIKVTQTEGHGATVVLHGHDRRLGPRHRSATPLAGCLTTAGRTSPCVPAAPPVTASTHTMGPRW